MTMQLEFKGTEKQVKWAQDIAAKLHSEILYRYTPRYGEAAAIKIADQSIGILHETTDDAEIWIDRRNDTVTETLTVVAELLKKAGRKIS